MAKRKESRSVALPAIREDVRRIAAAHGAGNVRVFGSVGRGEQDASSDLDLLVDMAEGRSLFDLIALSNDLEESLGVEVDVVTEASLSPYMRDRVLDEAVALRRTRASTCCISATPSTGCSPTPSLAGPRSSRAR